MKTKTNFVKKFVHDLQYFFEFVMFSFIFVDERPLFPRVRKTLNELNKHPDAFVLGHTYSFKDITSKTDLTGLEIIKH